jgi:hypothetical protein
MMAKSKDTFERRQRERAKKARAAAKRERRLTKDDSAPAPEAAPASADGQAAVLTELASLHAQFENESVSFDDFESRRAELLSRLQVD